MSQINVVDLTFAYEGGLENVFEHSTFSIDTNWKLGFIGRNGKGKTTFLKLLLGKQSYRGTIHASTVFDYFPYMVTQKEREQCACELLETWKPLCEEWRVLCELDKLGVDAGVLYRPFATLSFGERTKVMLAVLFSVENEFLLVDEPTNHLDQESREMVKQYLMGKKGFILVSHDRDLLDACVDHVLVLNRSTIEVQNGNFSSWWENKKKGDSFAKAENEKHMREIGKLRQAAKNTRSWADKNESTKIGFDPLKEPERNISTRAYIGAKTKKLQSQVKQIEKRIDREINQKEGLLSDLEETVELKLTPIKHHKEVLCFAKDYEIRYRQPEKEVFSGLTMEIRQGERVFLNGKNGCGKSSLLKRILYAAKQGSEDEAVEERGTLETASGLIISYVSQDTSYLSGTLEAYCKQEGHDLSLLCTLLRQLDFGRTELDTDLKNLSEGQKKKVLIASSLITPAHLYVWDEPLNYIDVFSRIQIENLILRERPTMLLVEHDVTFREKIATRIIEL